MFHYLSEVDGYFYGTFYFLYFYYPKSSCIFYQQLLKPSSLKGTLYIMNSTYGSFQNNLFELKFKKKKRYNGNFNSEIWPQICSMCDVESRVL